MRKKQLVILLLCSIIAFPIKSFAADRETSFPSHFIIKQIGIQQGLTNPNITTVHTDSYGYVWIGTKYLLNKYINGKLISYDSEETGGSDITMLFEELDETIWVGTESSLSRYDRETDEFTIIGDKGINCALEYKGKCYFAGKGIILIYDAQTTEVSTIQAGINNIINLFVVADNLILCVDKTGLLYFYNVESKRLNQLFVPEISDSDLTCAYFDNASLYIGVYYKGIYQIDIAGNILHKYLSKDFPDLQLDIVNDIKRIGPHIWFATNGSGLCSIDGNGIVPISQIPQYKALSDIPAITSYIYQDKYSNIWIGSTRDGLFGIKPTRIFCTDQYIAHNSKFRQNSSILSMEKADDGLWLGTETGLFKYFPENNSFTQEQSFNNDIINSIVTLKDDILLISSNGIGLFTYNTKTKAKQPFVILDQKTNNKEIMFRNGLNLTKLSKDEFLILGEDIYRYNINTDRTICLTPDSGILSSGLKVFHISDDSSIAYAFSEESLYLIDLIENRVSLIHTPNICGEISTAEYFQDSIFYGTASGLRRYDIAQKKDNSIYQGLFSRITHLCKKAGYGFWIACGEELFSIDTESHIIHIYDEAEGFSTKGVHVSALFDGNYYFGGINNLSVVPANISGTIENNPSITLVGVAIDGKAVPIENNRINIPHNHLKINLQFVSRRSDPFKKTMFKYYISGPESCNIETYDSNISISRLSYGNYSVSASYHSSDGFWSTPTQHLSIHVSKPFWQREWVIASIVFLLMLLTFLAISMNTRKNEQALQSAILENKTIESEKRYRFINSIEAEMAMPLSQIRKESKALLEEEDTTIDKHRNRIEKIYSKSAYLEKMIDVAIKQERPEKSDNPIINKLDDIIDSRISDPNLDVSTLVREMAMSRTALYDKIKDLSGMGINEYIQNRRLIKARKLLIDTQLSIAEIADELGFSSSKYFSETFKKTFEISPREFRKKIIV